MALLTRQLLDLPVPDEIQLIKIKSAGNKSNTKHINLSAETNPANGINDLYLLQQHRIPCSYLGLRLISERLLVMRRDTQLWLAGSIIVAVGLVSFVVLY